ncbi:MAG TPA: hypothetical protein VFK54_09480 [Candidatus Limnocylindrales bacterium]|nr:hypothetical protein [Candidatus Limnocylindrales bacterium]
MDDPLRRVLQLVAEGKLTAEEAAPILEALDEQIASPAFGGGAPAGPAPDATGARSGAAAIRIEVREHDRQVVNLRLPLALGRFALDRVPGISPDQTERIREALRLGVRGPILEVDGDNGDGVRIVVE